VIERMSVSPWVKFFTQKSAYSNCNHKLSVIDDDISYIIFRQSKSYTDSSEHENPAALRRKRKRYECLLTLPQQH
jgi:hypothetical protein